MLPLSGVIPTFTTLRSFRSLTLYHTACRFLFSFYCSTTPLFLLSFPSPRTRNHTQQATGATPTTTGPYHHLHHQHLQMGRKPSPPQGRQSPGAPSEAPAVTAGGSRPVILRSHGPSSAGPVPPTQPHQPLNGPPHQQVRLRLCVRSFVPYSVCYTYAFP